MRHARVAVHEPVRLLQPDLYLRIEHQPEVVARTKLMNLITILVLYNFFKTKMLI